jgi:2-polyprenyl-6-methoxyphenol hydroxylase-like FAD-dependent oxidoreductase
VTILILGGGIGGLTLALSLHQAGVRCQVFEAAPEIRPLGVGINLLPHGTRELTELGLQQALARRAVSTQEVVFCNRFGQLIYREPRGRFAGYEWPQFSIHRADLQEVLLDAVRARLGDAAIALGKKCVAIEQDSAGASVRFEDGMTERGSAVIGCDGVNSTVRKILYPDEGPPAYQGINMWRGVTRAKPYLSGSSMVIGGWLEVGKMVIYPIRQPGADGLQLINWVAEIQSPRNVMQDWNLGGKLDDFYPDIRELDVRLARCRGAATQCRHDPRVPDGRPRSATRVVARPGHAARRCGASRCIRAARTAQGRRSSTRAPSPDA